MKNINILLLLLLSINVLLFMGCGDNSTSPNGPNNNPGDPNPNPPPSSSGDAPDFTYTSLGGNQYTLSNYVGNVVYLFFFGAECPHCKTNGSVTETDIYQEFNGNANFTAFGLDTWNESASAVENFKNVTGITYPLLLNAEQSLIDYYGNTTSHDRSVVIDGDGNIAYKGTVFVNTDVDTVREVIEEELAKLDN